MADRRPSRALATALYGGTAVAALGAPALVDRLSRRVPRALAEFGVTGASVGGGFAAVAGVERLRPYRDEWNEPDGSGLTDLLHLAFSGSAALLVGAAVAAPVRTHLRGTTAGRALGRLPLPARLGVSILASDLFHTSLHRLVHEFEPLWRVHAVHHSALRLYSFNASRFHPLQAMLVVTGDNLVLAALGLDPRALVGHRVFRGIFGQIQHANVAIDSGVFNKVFSGPERHRWHHSTVPGEYNTNYGSVVCLWDKVFGTDYLPADREMDGAIGVNGMPDFPQDFRGQCEAPFRWNELRPSA